MISFDEAIAIIGEVARPLGTERVDLADAAGRVLAGPVVAAIDSPRVDVSAMDGYAVCEGDLVGFPVTLRIVGESFPGTSWQGTVEPGTCVGIFTGAPLPNGADRIVIQEQVRREGDVATIDADPGSATWIRRRGKDFRVGDEILPSGRRLDPTALIAAGAADLAEVDVFIRPRLALLATGDELAEPGEARNSALAVPDSVTLGLAALAERWGAQVVSRARLPDDLRALERAARAAIRDADVILVTGGASVGERDFAKAMFEPLGLELLFSRISMRPGKPAWLGRVGNKLVIGLPGNPTSALVTGRLLLAPMLAVVTGRRIESALQWEAVRLASPMPVCDARETFHRAGLANGEGSLLAFQESHAQKALADADVLVRQPANSPALAAGETVQALRL